MGNFIEYADVLQNSLDVQVSQQATSGWMEANAGQVTFVGGSRVRVPMLSTSGLGDYDRSGGKYPKNSFSLSYQDLDMRMDRAASFYFDRNDVDESNFQTTAASVVGEFQAANVIPEIDAYRYSEIAKFAERKGRLKQFSVNDEYDGVLSRFLSDVRELQDVAGGIDAKGLIATVPFSVLALMENDPSFMKLLLPQSFSQGGLCFEMKSLNGIILNPVSSSRLKTDYWFYSGAEDKFGFEPASGAVDINWIICPLSLPIAVSKTDKLKIFEPDVNQNGDGYEVQYRKYHDLWIKDNLASKLFVSVSLSSSIN